MGAWEDGFAAGWMAGLQHAQSPDSYTKAMFSKMSLSRARASLTRGPRKARRTQRTPRKASAYSKRYGAAFKRLAKKNKKKGGGWKKGGFARTQKAAHRAARK